MMTNYHEPVLLAETIRFLNLSPGKVIVDGTVGGGGHSEAILSEIQPGGCLIGLDADQEALETAQERLAPYGESAALVHANFSSLKTVLAKLDIDHIDGILLDLGVSSHQLDIPERGFSFRQDAPLDMRMDLSAPQTAADLVNTLSVEDLTKIFFELGEERWARRIAEFIAQTRKTKPIETTTELADLVHKAIPKAAWPPKIDPATRTFQALRIAVNRELEVLEKVLTDAIQALNPSGRICVISYHSLEDRIVKQHFLRSAGKCQCPPGLPICVCNPEKLIVPITRKPVLPSPEEIARNPRARSAKLRVAERCSL